MAQAIQAKKLTDVAAYRIAEEKLRTLKATESDTKRAVSETEQSLRRDANEVRNDAVAALLAGDAHQDFIRDKREAADNLRRLREELTVVQRAISGQEQALSSARAEASREICASLKPQHDAALREMALALVAANAAALRAAKIRNALAVDDVSTSSLPLVIFHDLGQGTLDPCSMLAYFTRECLTLRLLKRAEIPSDWCEVWGV